MNQRKPPLILTILDGFGYSTDYTCSAITPETMPFFFSLLKAYPWTTLAASGSAVGLPEGTPGNSAVGHFTLGAGKIIEQPLTQFSRMIKGHVLGELPVIKNNFTQLARSGAALHIIGLISDGGSHSRIEHTQALITLAGGYGIKKVVVHAILDGRDAPQKSAPEYLQRIDKTIQELPATTHAEIGTLQGRLYAMDRNGNTDRLRRAYEALTIPVHSELVKSWNQELERSYAQGLYDEIIPPIQLTKDPIIHDKDGLVFVNIRADRERELYQLLKHNKDLSFLISGINYEDDPHDQTICKTPHATDTLNDYLEKRGIKTFAIAESEKYAHITYFFDGGRETDRLNETRVIIQSDDPKNFASEPAMKAAEITKALLEVCEHNNAQFYLVNYANADMVGHSGDREATKRAVGCLDLQLKQLYETFVVKHHGVLFVTGDHGNAEDKCDNNPAHTTNPVYFIVASDPLINKSILEPMKGIADVKDVIIRHFLC